MNILQIPFGEVELKQEVPQENFNNNLTNVLHNNPQPESQTHSNKPQEKYQGVCNSNSGKKYLNNVIKKTKSITSLIRASSSELEGYDNYLISPIKDGKYRESAFTPLKNDSLLLFTPSMKLEVLCQSPFEKFQYSSMKKDTFFRGKCINFNNIDISPEASELNHEEKGEAHQIIIPQYFKENPMKCTCTKTSCQKKYCACYANGKYCDSCECENCENKGINQSNANSKRVSIMCNCTKSNCTKKYCECFKNGKNCSSLCRCINCINSPLFVEIKKKNKSSTACASSNKTVTYSMEGIGIEIRNNMISVIHRKVNELIDLSNEDEECVNDRYTPMKASGKKRSHHKMQSTNVKTPRLIGHKTKRRKKKLFSD